MNSDSPNPRPRLSATPRPITIGTSSSNIQAPWSDHESSRSGWGAAGILGILLAVMVATSVLSPLHFAVTLRKSLVRDDPARVNQLVEFIALNSCLREDAVKVTPSLLIGIFAPQPDHSSETSLHLRLRALRNAGIAGLKYQGISVAILTLSEGTTLELERTGIWSWRLFCATLSAGN